MNVIELRDVTKIYRRFGHRRQFATLKSALLSGSLIRDLRPDETFAALDAVSFAVQSGRTFGIVGRNGSGKSTALKLVAGITKPTRGTVRVDGRVSALIELGAGFHPEISGRENVYINGIMLGLSKREVTRRFDEIVAFAELEDFIDAPVKTYSSGMYLRLGFAVAIHVDPDVLLVDEVLAVGDEGFTHKCLDKFAEFRRRGKTILLVTHALRLVERFCDEALWLDGGRVRLTGDPKRVVDAYVTDVAKSEEQQLAAGDARTRRLVAAAGGRPEQPTRPGTAGDASRPERPPDSTFAPSDGQPPSASAGREPLDMFKAVEGRWGTRDVEIVDVTLLGPDGSPRQVYQIGSPMTIRLRVRAKTPVTDFAFGIGIFNAEGVLCYGTNTAIEELTPERLEGEGDVAFRIERLDLVEGTYKLDVAVHHRDGWPYDYHRLLYTFRVKSRVKDTGIFRLRHRWAFSPTVRFTRAARQVRGRAGGVLSRPEAVAVVERARAERRRVVFTNGVFDLLHPGHLRYLWAARRRGDLLVVGLNSDRSVRALKGPDRPLMPEAERAEILAALECIDGVVIFDEETPAEIVRALQPDVLVKGADWPEDQIVGRDTVEAHGGEVVRVPVEEGYSTSAIVARIRTQE
jgi:rfaE bifunctional protein nucleotidyltransferase chain/domain